ncbi:CLUMA_CG006840, isoform A [Clunio marinus]|uniref:CLUMA_CG006840, isoform A n=1 Tax=Clunio marinus TaxID=568069 RepID=A0A1J1I4I9_9DIPT|nr:CLUMA_CG006840, isoform A [Clunio marinus]
MRCKTLNSEDKKKCLDNKLKISTDLLLSNTSREFETQSTEITADVNYDRSIFNCTMSTIVYTYGLLSMENHS